jgi:tetratricopeptide (TPR) repeat protein
VAEVPQGYQNVPEEDQKKAQVFFDYGTSAASTGNYEYAIEMYLQGLALDPDSTDAHQKLRDISLKRKASGGKDLGFMDKMKLGKAGNDDRASMVNATKLLSYDPGNTDRMLQILQAALRAGFYDTVMWLGPILQKANADDKKPDFNKFIILKDAYKTLKQWKLATDACTYALRLRPDDMDLQTEMKNLGAQHTMTEGKYGSSGSFRDSIKDMAGQAKLLAGDKDIRNVDVMGGIIADAELDYLKDPNEPGKLMKLVEALVKSESPEYENRAIELLDKAYQRTKQFRFRHSLGKIKMSQLSRMERSLRANLQANPTDPSARQQYAQFLQEKLQEELTEMQLWVENYPTETAYRMEVAKRMFELKQYGEAIPVFQQVRSDPKHRIDAGILLGQSFLGAEFVEEAIDTLKGLIDEYQLKGDDRSKRMTYWYGRALEQKGDTASAIKAYSQVAMMEFNFRDVQARIKKLRSAN